MGDNSVTYIFGFLICIGLCVAYWFWDASQFLLPGNQLNFEQSTFLPVSCSINVDKAADVTRSMHVYFWQDQVRIDVRIFGEKPIAGHQIVASGKIGYLWRDDSTSGDVANNVTTHPLIDNVTSGNQWFCFPWVFFDPSVFTPPKNVTFQ
jgi:hypothetical protein